MDERVGRTTSLEPEQPKVTPAPLVPPPVRRAGRSPLRWLFGLVLLAVLGGAGYWLYEHFASPAPVASSAGRGRNAEGPPQPVGAATIDTGDIHVTLSQLGTVTPLATVTVKTQINGQLVQVAFQEGQMVKEGEFLAQIDPRPYQVSLAQALGTLAHDQAVLKQNIADLARYKTLTAQDSIAKQTYDDQVALVLQTEGTIKNDQASVDSSRLNLVYCHIVAPVTGRVGLRQVDQGNYVQTTDTNGLVVITQLQPISVVFTLPEDALPQVVRAMHGPEKLQVTAFDRTNTIQIATGTLETLDNQVDTTTGTVKARANFANADEALFPNQFVNATLLVTTLHDVVRIPSAGIQRGAPGTYAYLINPDNTVSVRPIKLGPTDGDVSQVTEGLQPGDRVVVDGADRLRDGQRVVLPPPAGASPARVRPAGSPAANGGAARQPRARPGP